MLINPEKIFQETIILTVPHMDDGILACGGTIAKLPDKECIHVIYATDGMGSPAPILPWADSISPDLGAIRTQEARDAMGYLGVPQKNIHFLALPDGQLKKHTKLLNDLLIDLIGRIEPDHILMPFRYDRHTDHLALNHVITTAHRQSVIQAKLTEYFVYYRWRLLPAGDIRCYVRPQYLSEIDIKDVSSQKRVALDCFKSQTTRFYSWQARPNLTPQLLDEVSHTPEFFVQYDAHMSGAAIFNGSTAWIRVAHRLEPFMKKKKDQIVALWRRGSQSNGRKAI